MIRTPDTPAPGHQALHSQLPWCGTYDATATSSCLMLTQKITFRVGTFLLPGIKYQVAHTSSPSTYVLSFTSRHFAADGRRNETRSYHVPGTYLPMSRLVPLPPRRVPRLHLTRTKKRNFNTKIQHSRTLCCCTAYCMLMLHPYLHTSKKHNHPTTRHNQFQSCRAPQPQDSASCVPCGSWPLAFALAWDAGHNRRLRFPPSRPVRSCMSGCYYCINIKY